jgi:hypothetical protein
MIPHNRLPFYLHGQNLIQAPVQIPQNIPQANIHGTFQKPYHVSRSDIMTENRHQNTSTYEPTYKNSSNSSRRSNAQSGVFTKKTHDQVPLLERKIPRMKDIRITEGGVLKLLQGLNISKARGPDEISPKILKELSNELTPIMTHFFQQTMDKSTLPEDWTTANICPLYKKADRSIPANYRPVSLTCILCKLAEHIVSSNIMSHLEEHNVITDKQHAFRKYHSCETQLCSVIHDWARNIDKNKQTDIFILDFEKAFDTVPHEQLKAKLYRYGITGNTLMWIGSFLCYRKQCVVVNGTSLNGQL